MQIESDGRRWISFSAGGEKNLIAGKESRPTIFDGTVHSGCYFIVLEKETNND
jgi:hypothetical protein